MMIRTRLASLFLAGMALVPSHTSQAANPLDSAYEGQMNIEGSLVAVPLSLQLRQTEELEQITTPAGTFTQYRIDGSFIVDEEGGPYKLARVTFDYETGEIDMRYSRGGTPSEQPTSLRLSGFIQPDHSITGTVYSGLVGNIGTFSVQQRPGLVLATRAKYVGMWGGQGVLVASGAARKVNIVLASTQGININPDTTELGFSLAKTGTFYLSDVSLPFSTVTFDYLRHRLIMRNDVGGGVIDSTVQADVDPRTGNIKGFTTGVHLGKSIEFTMRHDGGGPL
jgi:hypothetical protein